mmetsp:Transcript_58943/g.123115  ORF Transcript_58943/g.123115 Transcript_58943/m.123115 type:complete len:116 (+) Transcript_58943:552-899(+)
MSARRAARVSGFPARPQGLRISPRLGPELIQTTSDGTRVQGENASSAELIVDGSKPTALARTTHINRIAEFNIRLYNTRTHKGSGPITSETKNKTLDAKKSNQNQPSSDCKGTNA